MSKSPSADAARADVIVVGAGVLGTFHAYFAAKKGYKTLLLERNAFPGDASTRNFGMVLQTIVETGGEWSAYARSTAAIYRAMQQERDLGVVGSGSLYLASTEVERQVLQEFAELFAERYECRYLTASDACRRYPFANASYCQGALYFANDLTVEPRRLVREIISYLVESHVLEYQPFSSIVAVEPAENHCLVRDARGAVFVADHVFVCGGAEYRTLFPDIFKASGLRVCKLQLMRTEAQPQVLPHALLSGLSIQRYPAFRACPSYPALAEQAMDETLRHYGIHLLMKQAADGTIVIGDSHEYQSFEEASAVEEITSAGINRAVLEYGRRMVSLPTWEIQSMWNGYYLTHPEREIFTEDIGGTLHIVTGIGGKGMSTGPGYAKAHVNSVLGE